MACELPGAHSPEELWQNVLAGRRSFRKAPPERLPPDYFDPDPAAPGKSYCDVMAVLSGWSFDPVEFHIPPVTFAATDMAHWLALHTARAAIRSAGLKLDSLDRSRVGVVLGNSLTGEFSRSHNLRFRWPYVERSLRRACLANGLGEDAARKLIADARAFYEGPLPEITEDTLAGNMANTIAGRICNFFDLGGGGFTVDGACSSSLLSVATACDALANGEMDIVLAGGVDVSLDPFEIVGFAKTRALTTDDIRPYDERANGMLTGEGCGIVVLAREDAARAAGRPVRALIRGWGYSSDGAGGLTAPEVEGQIRALRRAYERAGYSMGTVGLIEGHGTGTSLGDKVELTAIRRLLEEEPGAGVCRIGSIKANIGHCKAAAGIAGFIKAVLALERKIIPPTVNCEHPSAVFGMSMPRLRPSLDGGTWMKGSTPRRASVSGMGFGGANAHVTLEEANPEAAPPLEDLALLGSGQSSELIIVAADSAEGLRKEIEKLLPLARRLCRAELTDLSAALMKHPVQGKLRLGIVAQAPWSLAETLRGCLEKIAGGVEIAALDDPARGVFAGVAREDPKLVALFPGQGSQRLNMGMHWLRRFPFVRDFYEAVGEETSAVPCTAADRDVDVAAPKLAALSKTIFRDQYSADDETRQAWENELRDTCVAQPAIVLTSMATMQVLQFFGLEPSLAIGHSLGEISALAAAGAWDAVTAVRLAAGRGQAMAALPLANAGSMAAVMARVPEVERLVASLGSGLVIANYNSPRQIVVSGSSEAIRKLARLCEESKMPCRLLAVSHAFHSPLVAPAAEVFRKTSGLYVRPATERRAQFLSTVTGQMVAVTGDLCDYLAEQIRRPVRFVDAVLKAVEAQPSLWIEVGPGGVLSGFVRDILSPVDVSCLPTDLAGEDGFHLLNQVLARAWVLGFPVRLERLFAHRFHRELDVDHYEPQFIVNPCERPVEAGARSSRPGRGGMETLRSNQKILPPEDRDSLLALALEWIAERTGFPMSALSPEKRLRDDLNLDSIKVGELVVWLTRKLNRPAIADPAAVANGRISDLVEAILSRGPKREAGEEAVSPGDFQAGPADSLGEWTRTFRMELVPAPLAKQAGIPLRKEGVCVIVAERNSSRAGVIADRLRKLGLSPMVKDVAALVSSGDAPANLTALIVLLPEARSNFLACGPEEFDQRVEGMASLLFRAFRWAGHGREAAGLRGLVMRAADGAGDSGGDIDGGSGFLKSLGLEYPGAEFKWLALPAQWPPERWAEVVADELDSPRDRVSFAYSLDGRRWSRMAQPLVPSKEDVQLEVCKPAAQVVGAWDTVFLLPDPRGPATKASVRCLGPEDVVLVSGGAKGITCELALGLGLQTRARFALLGSSPAPAAAADPVENEALRNLQRFAQAGLQCLYLQADVTDLVAVRRAVHDAEEALGPITAILHGAGVTHLRLFREKELEEFLQCVRVKTRGLYNLLVAVSPERLRALHVISSVIGHTGMRGQADYALANAWLACAVRAVKAAHPRIHCLSLGYTAWAETGLARRVGALDSLRALGVRPVTVQEGVAAYLALACHPEKDGDVVITGRLAADLEAGLYARADDPRGRFLEQIRRWVPGVELVADARLSHETDLYLPEHVLEGTPVFPGVMAVEAMVQAAMACAGRADWPVVQNVQFRAPLIVPAGASVVMRTMALAEVADGTAVCVRMAVRSERDGFKQNHFEAKCYFEGVTAEAEEHAPNLPQPLPEPLDQNPEDFSPTPLFQGKFFRRICEVRRIEMGDESLTVIQVPSDEQYFAGAEHATPATPSPVVRDACLQSGALILPPGCLPDHIEELRFLGRPAPEARVVCRTWVRSQGGGEFVVDIAAFDEKGRLLETMRHLRLKQSGIRLAVRPPARPLTPARVAGDLQALLPRIPHGFALVDHEEATRASMKRGDVSDSELERLRSETAPPRQVSVMANLMAARRAAAAFSSEMALEARTGITLAHDADGKPELRFADEVVAKAFEGTDASLTDGGGFSAAWIGPAPVGVDLERVERRDTETWRGLLGDDGYRLALDLAAQAAEPFDAAATRVWTILEVGKKALGLRRIVPRFESSLGGSWLCLAGSLDGVELEFLSATLELPDREPTARGGQNRAVLTVAVPRAVAFPAPVRPDTSFDCLLADFRAAMARLKLSCAHDPQAPGMEDRHAEFIRVIKTTSQRLEIIEKTAGAGELPALRKRFQIMLREFLDGSENFQHTLAQPFGYAGDFQLLEMLAANHCGSRGLAFHFDQSQLEYPASVACRERIRWICDQIAGLAQGLREPRLTILDLGIGAGPVERELARTQPGLSMLVQAVDLEPDALAHVEHALAGGKHVVHPWRLDLRDPAALATVDELAADAGVCIMLGILEALTEAEAERLLRTVLRALLAGSVLLAENFVPAHPTRSVMEWFLNFHLCYRSLEQLQTLAAKAGADPSRTQLQMDPTGNLALLKVIK